MPKEVPDAIVDVENQIESAYFSTGDRQEILRILEQLHNTIARNYPTLG